MTNADIIHTVVSETDDGVDTAFAVALERTMKFEGGWSNDPDDNGGKTKFGITEATWNLYNYPNTPPRTIEQLTIPLAVNVYRRLYWSAANLESLSYILPTRLTNDIFDACVNHGTFRGCLLLQRAYNFIRRSHLPELREDGIIGGATLDALAAFLKLSDYENALLGAFRGERYTFYVNITKHNISQMKFIRSWMKRLVD